MKNIEIKQVDATTWRVKITANVGGKVAGRWRTIHSAEDLNKVLDEAGWDRSKKGGDA